MLPIENKTMIQNEQKHNWAWRERLFYLCNDGSVYELTFWYTKHGYNYYLPPLDKDIKNNVVARIICKSKVNHALTVQTRKIQYNK